MGSHDGATRAVRASPGSAAPRAITSSAGEASPEKLVRAKDSLGRYGEELAARHLLADGFVILERNWRCSEGEIDIVARDGDVLVVCEVKTRSSLSHGSPFEAVTERKLHRVQRLGLRWMRERGVRPASLRVDVVSVLRPVSGRTVIEHVRGLA